MISSRQKQLPTFIVITLGLSIAVFATTYVVHAENATTTNSANPEIQTDIDTPNTRPSHSLSNTPNGRGNATASSSERRAVIQQNQAERSDAIKTRVSDIKAAHAERKAAFQAATQTRLTNLAANLSNQMDATVARIQNVIDRLYTRIDKLKADGVDTSASETSLAVAQQEIDKASSMLSSIDSDVATFIGSENPKAGWQSLKQTYSAARDAIKGSHQALVTSILTLKAAVLASNPKNEGVAGAISSSDQTTNASTSEKSITTP